MKDAGIIGFVPRGEYSDTETYDFLQFVYYGDSSYVAKKETKGNKPAENNEYWQLLAKGRYITPTVKQTNLKISNGDLVIKGRKNNVDTDITEIFKKAYTGTEGMDLGVASNGVGYIQAQNFWIKCSLLTDEEKQLIQSFTQIKIEKANNSVDYPTLMPSQADYEVGVDINGKNGYIHRTVKMGIRSYSGTNYFFYNLPSEFRNDVSSDDLVFYTTEWVTFVGIDIKNRG